MTLTLQVDSRIVPRKQSAGLIPYMDKDAIRSGEQWQIAIRTAIKNSQFFILLFSFKSVEDKGYLQKLKYAIDIFDKFPDGGVYLSKGIITRQITTVDNTHKNHKTRHKGSYNPRDMYQLDSINARGNIITDQLLQWIVYPSRNI
jgi:hypothetical protein